MASDTIVTLEEEMASLLSRSLKGFHKDIEPHYIGKFPTAAEQLGIQPPPVPPRQAGPVENFLSAFKRVQEATAKGCIETAEWLEHQAEDLRRKAAVLNNQATQIPNDLRDATTFEIDTRERMKFLASLNPATSQQA